MISITAKFRVRPVQSAHFLTARQTVPPHLVETPRIVSIEVPQEGWSELGELAVGP